jgi:hypothetical protein
MALLTGGIGQTPMGHTDWRDANDLPKGQMTYKLQEHSLPVVFDRPQTI